MVHLKMVKFQFNAFNIFKNNTGLTVIMFSFLTAMYAIELYLLKVTCNNLQSIKAEYNCNCRYSITFIIQNIIQKQLQNKKNSNYQLLAVVLLSDQAKVLEPSPPYPGYGHPNKLKVYRVSMYVCVYVFTRIS